jgi:hypothetical protein
MKTLKFALIAVLVAFTMVSFANSDGFRAMPKFKKIINLSVDKATQNPGLVRAMYQQVSKAEFMGTHEHIFVAMVYYQGNTYRISGSYDQWMKFFTREGVSTPIVKFKGPAN